MITFNEKASWCANFTHEHMSNELIGSYDIHSVAVPQTRTPGATMVYIDAFEPDFVSSPVDAVHANIKNIDLILSRRPEILAAYPDKARKFIFGTTHLVQPRTENKSESVSFTMTGKRNNLADGYNLRWNLIENASTINFSLPFHYYDSSKVPALVDYPHRLGETKEQLFDSMFSVIIENQRLPNYITEKLIDCILSKTVPLYFGSPNVADYFDTSGMIIIRDFTHLKEVLENLTVEDYETRKNVMQKNLDLAQDFARPLADRTIEAIKQVNT